MLNCNLCDYYSNKKGAKKCDFSGFHFVKNPVDMEKYPCANISYEEFLAQQESSDAEEIVA